MKTLLQALHRDDGPPGQHRANCPSREHNGGKCPGEEMAAYLNGLGEDDAPFVRGRPGAGVVTTVGQVRRNWLAHWGHLCLAPAVQ